MPVHDEMAAFVANVTHPEYWAIGVVAGIAPMVVPAPAGYVVGGIVAVAMVLGLTLVERVGGRDVDDQEGSESRQKGMPLGSRHFAGCFEQLGGLWREWL